MAGICSGRGAASRRLDANDIARQLQLQEIPNGPAKVCVERLGKEAEDRTEDRLSSIAPQGLRLIWVGVKNR
jgi:hypothetical protein